MPETEIFSPFTGKSNLPDTSFIKDPHSTHLLPDVSSFLFNDFFLFIGAVIMAQNDNSIVSQSNTHIRMTIDLYDQLSAVDVQEINLYS